MSTFSFFITEKCNIECSHCCLNSSPRLKDSIDIDDVVQFSRIFNSTDFDTVVFTGGEPSVVGKKLFTTIESLKIYKKNIRLVTNCLWAGTASSAERFLGLCLASGVDQIAFSTSEFHQEFVSIERVARAWHTARSMNFRLVTVIASHEFDDDYHQLITSRLSELAPLNAVVRCVASKVEVTRVQRIGRFRSDNIPSGRSNIYRKNPYRVRCPASVTSPAISAVGHLWACAGMDLTGNQFLDFGRIAPDNVVERYREMRRSTIPMAIRYLGPGFLLKFIAEKDGCEYRKDLISFCEICQDLTRKPEFKAGLVRHEAEIRLLLREKMQELGLPDIDSIEANAPAPGSPVQALPSS